MINRIELQGFDISGKSVAVLGCGGLGCNIATHLTCAGIGRLLLCDFDCVSETNLNRQFLYTAADIGKPKAELARRRLCAISPQMEIETYSVKFDSPEDLAFAKNADIVFAALDNNAARLCAQRFCAVNGIPLVNGGVNAFFGTAYLYIPGKTPDLTAAGMLEAQNRKTRSVSSTVGVIGSLEAHLGIQYLLGNTTCAGLLHVFDNGQITTLKIKGF